MTRCDLPWCTLKWLAGVVQQGSKNFWEAKFLLISYFLKYHISHWHCRKFSFYMASFTTRQTYALVRPSRWWRRKMWRSPSSSQTHQKYIYMWNNSYRTPTERWQKTSDFPKGKKLPRYRGRVKENRKKQTQKNRDRTCTSGRELWRRKSFHTLGRWEMGGGQGGIFGATEESTATGVQRAKRRDSRTEDQGRPALTSLRGLSAHPPGQVGAGSWGSGCGDQIPGRGLGLAVWSQPEGG